MKKITVLVLAIVLICSFCSCKPLKEEAGIPVISNSSDQVSTSSTIAEESSSKESSSGSIKDNNSSETKEENNSSVSSAASKNSGSNSSSRSPIKEPSSSSSKNNNAFSSSFSSSALSTSFPSENSSSSKVSVSSTNQDSSKEETANENTDNSNKYKNFKICYAQLTEKQKGIYDALEQAVNEMEIGWINLKTPVYEGYRRDINIVVTALQNDMPEYFWVPPAYYTGNSPDRTTIRLLFEGQDDLTYLVDKSERKQMEKQLSDKVQEIMSQVTATTPFEIELQLHDILCNSITYAERSEDPLVYTAYGALVKGEAVCEGYSRAMQLLLAQCGIKSTLVTGLANDIGHMWNLVYIENGWYHLDATWNDLKSGEISHTYFNLTDSEMSKDHMAYATHLELTYDEIVCETPTPYNFKLPICNKSDNNYFVKKDYIYGPNGEEKIAKILMEPFDIIEFKFSSDAFRTQFESQKTKYLLSINEILSREKSDFRISKFQTTHITIIIYR